MKNILLSLPFLILLGGCSAQVLTFDPQSGNKISEAKIPYGYSYNIDTKELKGDPVIMDAASQTAVKLIENNPEATARIAELMQNRD